MHLARAHNLSAYDAAYLELAIRLGLPLACLDGRLKTAAAASGVVLFSPPGKGMHMSTATTPRTENR